MNRYLELLVQLAASIARECGYLANDAEQVIGLIEGGTRLESTHRKLAIEEFTNSIKSTSSPEEIAKLFLKTFKKQPHTLAACIDTMLRIFTADKSIKNAADKNIKRVAEILKFPVLEYQKLRAHHLGITLEEAQEQFRGNGTRNDSRNMGILYAQLGCTPTAKLEEVKKAYRQLALIYHPDRTKVLEISQEVENDLYLRFQEIKTAYETLIKKLST